MIRKLNHKAEPGNPPAQELGEVFPAFVEEYWKRGRAEINSSPISHSQFQTLEHVHRQNECTMNELAKALEKAPSTVTGQVDRLIRRGLLARQCNEDDRRTVRVMITPTGQQILRDLVARRKKVLSTLFGMLDLAEQAAYLKTTEMLVARIDLAAREDVGCMSWPKVPLPACGKAQKQPFTKTKTQRTKHNNRTGE